MTRDPARQRGDVALRIAATLAAVAFISVITFVPLSQNDFWLQSAIGRIIVQTGEIPRTVLFPFTWVRDYPFNAHEWLPSIAFYLLDKTLGYGRLLFIQGALGLALFGLSAGLAFRLSGSAAAALLLACMAMVVANYRHYLRPEILALVFFLLQLHLLTSYRRRRDWRTLVFTAPIAVLWANSHGSFLVGPAVAGIFAIGEAAESARHNTHSAPMQRARSATLVGMPYALTAGAMLSVSLINPLGIGLFRFVHSLSGSEVTKTFIREWNPTFAPEFMSRPGFSIFVAACAATLAVVLACWRRLRITEALLLASFLLLAVTRMRFVVLFGFVSLVVCASLLGAGAWRRECERTALAVCVGVAMVGLAVALRFGNAYGAYPYYAQSTDFTRPMIDQLSKPGMQGNVLNSYELGAELIHRTYPRLRPSIDSRIDSYGDRYFLLHENLFVDELPLQRFIADFDVRYMLLLWRDFEQLKKMPGLRSDWEVRFADHKAVLLSRRDDSKPYAASAAHSEGAVAPESHH